MKTSKLSTISGMFALALIVTLALTACPADTNSGGETPTARSAGTEKPLTFGTGCKVTIKSDDKFTDAEWNTLCDKVAAMIKRGYDNASTVGKIYIEGQFVASNTKMVILGNSFSYNWETKASEPGVLYVKTTSIDSIVIGNTDPIDKLLGNESGNG
jgi:hypothetical protein